MTAIEIPYFQVDGLTFAEVVSGFPMNPETDPAVPMSGSNKDRERLEKLARATGSSGDDCALKGVGIRLVIKAPQYWWLQAERYHWFDIVSSQSKMHMLTKMKLDYQVNEWVEQDTLDRLKEAIDLYNDWDDEWSYGLIDSSDLIFESKEFLWQYIISNCPMGLYLSAGITTNYLQLKTMYHQRKNHKLKEWQEFCKWVRGLPKSNLITGKQDN